MDDRYVHLSCFHRIPYDFPDDLSVMYYKFLEEGLAKASELEL